jgi:receptor expression-enhancing protein 5/6
MYFFLIFFNVAAEFLVNTVGFIVPAYYSLHALFTSGAADDTQWLTVRHFVLHIATAADLFQYWVVYAFLKLVYSWR